MADLNEFQSKIGYTFKNKHLLEQALTHSSYANEKHMKSILITNVWSFGRCCFGNSFK